MPGESRYHNFLIYVDLEHDVRVRLDRATGRRPQARRRRDDELPCAARVHANDAFVEAGNDVRGVSGPSGTRSVCRNPSVDCDLGAVREPERVVGRGRSRRYRGRARPDGLVLVIQAARRLRHCRDVRRRAPTRTCPSPDRLAPGTFGSVLRSQAARSASAATAANERGWRMSGLERERVYPT